MMKKGKATGNGIGKNKKNIQVKDYKDIGKHGKRGMMIMMMIMMKRLQNGEAIKRGYQKDLKN